jgi:hypothetical protein
MSLIFLLYNRVGMSSLTQRKSFYQDLYCFGQGDEALYGNVGLSSRAFSPFVWAAASSSFRGAAQHTLPLHANVAPELEPTGGFSGSRVSKPNRPSRGRDGRENSADTPQFKAMGRWMLGVAQELLDPELGLPSDVPAGEGVSDLLGNKKLESREKVAGFSSWRTGSSGRRARMTPRQRFEFLAQQVLLPSRVGH